MSGTATFSYLKGDKNKLIYEEVGKLRINNKQIVDAKKKYQYVLKGKNVEVLFEDGRLFHVSKNGAEAKHLCGNDCYKTYYTFNNNNFFEIKHVVKGPEKDYVSNTEYNRSSQ